MAKTSKTSKAKTTKKDKKEANKNIDPNTGTQHSPVENPEPGPTEESIERSVKNKLIALYRLQSIDYQIDKLRIVRGELPLEVQDLEDEIAGLETRVEKFNNEIQELENEISNKKIAAQESLEMVKKYEAQQMNVRNNREYDSLSKEIEYQTLEAQIAEKQMKEYAEEVASKKEMVKQVEENLEERRKDLEEKKEELNDIVAETEKDEARLLEKSKKQREAIEDRLLNAYQRVRDNARNGLAVVPVERDACGGCFNKIPPQRHLDIRLHKKIIVCEYCGRILVDDEVVNSVEENH
ncbi:MAG: C4-type zinc ribbon domain-containing protein [Bacteroidales bacterium]